MSEAALRTMLRTRLSPYGIIKRIENRVDVGMPDILYTLRGTTGLIELKYLASWPKRPETPVIPPHVTKEQTLWLYEWERNGGRALMLLQVGKEYLLLKPMVVHQLGKLNRGELTAAVEFAGPWNTPAILKVLTS